MKKTTFLGCVAALLVGCLDSGFESGSNSQPVIRTTTSLPSFRIAMNGLSAESLAMARLSADPLPVTWVDGHFEADPSKLHGLADHDQGREVLRYLVGCALPLEVEVVVPTETGDLILTGHVGLTPEWAEQPLSGSGQRWISACLLAHVNALGEHVAISLRGPHPGLEVSQAERSRYSVQEAAFYGNLFRLRNQEDRPIYACDGGDIYLGHGDSDYLALRLCGDVIDETAATPCGFTYTGACAPFAMDEDKTWACEKSAGPYRGFSDCLSRPITNSGQPTTFPYPEVITVFLENTGWDGANGLFKIDTEEVGE